jgi:hypothetical protein
MFDFLKKKTTDPIAQLFANLTNKQRMSIMNFLSTIIICDKEQGDFDKELIFLNKYSSILDVDRNKSMEYLSEGLPKMINDLNTLSQSLKDFLVIIGFEAILCDGKANNTELEYILGILQGIGFKQNDVEKVLDNAKVLESYFFEKK